MSSKQLTAHDDPARVYARQDFGTKDRYRRAVEQLARRSRPRRAARRTPRLLELANAAGGPRGRAGRYAAAHVGYYLLGPVARRLLMTRTRLSANGILQAACEPRGINHPEVIYFGACSAAVAPSCGVLGLLLCTAPAASRWQIALVLVAALLPATELAVGFVHYLITLLLPPRVLAKLDFKDGISADCATFVVMPTMFTSEHGIADLVDRLEVHYLSNPDPALRYALLTDFTDAPAEAGCPRTTNWSPRRLRNASQRLRNPPLRGGQAGPLLPVSPRPALEPGRRLLDGLRAEALRKLGEFNQLLLRRATDTSYTTRSAGDPPSCSRDLATSITLDADTQLPREAAARLVATLAHPLNRPRVDPSQGRVVEGYGVLQPRVSLSLLAGTRSLFARLLASSAGIDPYTTAVSDVYQDLFGRGTYTGKGIYDVDAFEAAAGQAFPDNRILSHDLIEGNYARCGLATDIELLDDFPSRYNAYARREHRWVRGDWQIARWVLPTVPAPRHTPGENR